MRSYIFADHTHQVTANNIGHKKECSISGSTMRNQQSLKYVIPVILLCCTTRCLAAVEPSTLMGLESGKLLKCNFENSSDCTQLTAQDSALSSLAVSGEFIYLGLYSGELRRCRLANPKNCTIFHTFLSEINDLAISGKYIYAAYSNGIIKCGLRKSDDCTEFYVTKAPVSALAISGRHLYMSVEDSILACSLSHPEGCSASNNFTTAVKALSVFGNSLYVGLQEGAVQSCELHDFSECTEVFNTTSEIKAIDIFNDHIITSLDTGDIVRFVNDGSNETLVFGNKTGMVLSLFTIFDTTSLSGHYSGESIDCTWQFSSCPPYIIYYDVEARAQFELHVNHGKLYSITGELFDTDEAAYSHSGKNAIFVMDPAGRIYASNTHPILLLHHSSLMAGDPVSAAGELKVKDGVIHSVSACSGHYRPSYALAKQILISLRKQGYNRTVNVRSCFGLPLLIDLDYKKTDLYYKARYNEYLRKLTKLKLKL